MGTAGNILISLTTALDPLVNNDWLRNAFCEDSGIFPELCFSGIIVVLAMPVLTRHEDGLFAQQIFVLAFQRAVLARNELASLLAALPITLDHAPDGPNVMALARRHRLSAYDAAYLELAQRLNLPLASLHAALLAAARAENVVVLNG